VSTHRDAKDLLNKYVTNPKNATKSTESEKAEQFLRSEIALAAKCEPATTSKSVNTLGRKNSNKCFTCSFLEQVEVVAGGGKDKGGIDFSVKAGSIANEELDGFFALATFEACAHVFGQCDTMLKFIVDNRDNLSHVPEFEMRLIEGF
jgi:hypothetical protein